MPATYRTIVSGGSTSGTSDRAVAITPVVGDLLVCVVCVAANSNSTPTCSDGNTGGTYTRVLTTNILIAAVNYRLSVFVRDAVVPNTTSTTVTAATGSNTSGVINVIAIAGMTKVGAAAVRQSASQSDIAAGTPAPALGVAARTQNVTIGAVGNGTNPATMTTPVGWTERADTGFASDTVGQEIVTRDSGFTGTTVTWGSASASRFASAIVELDTSKTGAVAATTTVTVARTSRIGKPVTAVATLTVLLARSASKPIAAAATLIAALARRMGKTIAAAAVATAAVVAGKIKAQAIAATGTLTVALSRRVGKVLAAATSVTVVVVRGVRKAVSATGTLAAAFGRKVGKLIAAMTSVAADYPSAILADAPVAYWRLGESSGTNAADSSGNAHAGTYSGTPTLAQTGLVSGADTSVSFDGIDDYVDLSNPSELRLTSAFSVEAWVNVPGSVSQQPPILAQIFDTNTVNYALGFTDGSNNSLKPSIGFYKPSNWAIAQSPDDITTDAVHHLVGTWDGTSLRMYVDKVLKATTTPSFTPFSPPSTSNYRIGRRWDGATFYKGLIDEVAIYSTTLSSDRIIAHYDAGLGSAAATAPRMTAVVLAIRTLLGQAVVVGDDILVIVRGVVVKPQAVAALTTITAAIARRIGKPIAAAMTLTAVVGKRLGKLVAATTTLTAAIKRRTSHTIAVVGSFAATVTSGHIKPQAIAASTTLSGAVNAAQLLGSGPIYVRGDDVLIMAAGVVDIPGAIFIAASATMSVVLLRRAGKLLAASVRFVEDEGAFDSGFDQGFDHLFVKMISTRVGKLVAVTSPMVVAIRRASTHAIAVTTTFVVALGKRLAQQIAATMTMGVAFTRRVGKTVAVAVTLAVTLAKTKVATRLIAATSTITAAFSRRAGKLIAVAATVVAVVSAAFQSGAETFDQAIDVTTTFVVAFTRRVGKPIAATVPITVTFARRTGLSIAATVSFVVTLGRIAVKTQIIAAATTIAVTFRRLTAKTIPAGVSFVVTFTTAAAHKVAVAVGAVITAAVNAVFILGPQLYHQAVAVTTTLAVSITKRLAVIVAAAVSLTASITRRTAKRIAASTVVTVAFVAGRVISQLIAAAVTLAVEFRRTARLRLAVEAVFAAVFVRQIAKRIAAHFLDVVRVFFGHAGTGIPPVHSRDGGRRLSGIQDGPSGSVIDDKRLSSVAGGTTKSTLDAAEGD